MATLIGTSEGLLRKPGRRLRESGRSWGGRQASESFHEQRLGQSGPASLVAHCGAETIRSLPSASAALPWKKSEETALAAAEGIEAGEHAGLVHGELKPPIPVKVFYGFGQAIESGYLFVSGLVFFYKEIRRPIRDVPVNCIVFVDR